MRIAFTFIVVGLCLSLATQASAGPVGEQRLTAINATAALRDAAHRDRIRVTVWYPAAAGAIEATRDIGPPGKPLFLVGAAASDAAFADAQPRPVILFSHGFGGDARIMAWFALPLARAGYVVIAVDHPGNNADDPKTVAGSIMFWDRPGDLAAALAAVKADPQIGPHLDLNRLGVAGFSAGGFTAIAATGAPIEVARFQQFCADHPSDAVCAPQPEFPVTQEQAKTTLASPELSPEVAQADGSHAIPGVKGAFAIAPAIVQAFDPAGLKQDRTPVAIILGDADASAPPATNGRVAARYLADAKLTELPGVTHYDFLAACTPAGVAAIPICAKQAAPDRAHKAAIDQALAFFAETLGAPPAVP